MIISMNNHIRTKSSLNPEDCNKPLIYILLPLTTIDIIVISPLDNFPILLVYINNDLEKTSDYISVCKALQLLLWFSSSDNCYVVI